MPVRDSFFPRGSGGSKEKEDKEGEEGAAAAAPTDANPMTDLCCCFHQGVTALCCSSFSSETYLRPNPCLVANILKRKKED